MKKLLHKSCQWLLMLVAMFAMSMSASAGTKAVTFDLNDYEWTMNRFQFVKDGVTASFNGGSADGQYNLYSYGGGNLYLVSPDADIVKVEMECVAFRGSSPNVYYAAQVCQWTGEYNANATSFTNMSTTDDGIAIWEGTPARTLYFTASEDMDVRALTVYINDGNDGGIETPDPVVQPNFPVENTAYQLKHSFGNFLSLVQSADKGTVLAATQQALYFTWDQGHGAFTIKNDAGYYVGGHAEKDWLMSSSVPEYWNVVELDGGLYRLQRADNTAKYLGFDATTAGSAAFRNKAVGSAASFTIEAYQTPTVDPGTGGGTTDGGTNGSVTFNMSNKSPGAYTEGVVKLETNTGWTLNSMGIVSQAAGNSLKFSATDGSNITKIVIENGFAYMYAFSGGSFSANPVGTVSVLDSYYTWEGSAPEVTITTGYNAIVAKTITVEYAAATPDPGTDPVDPGTGTDPDPAVKPSFPAEGVAYQLQVDGENLYLNLQNHTTAAAVLGNKAEAIYFTWDETNKAFTVADEDGNYAGVSTANGWNMGSTTPDYWTLEQDANAYYLVNTTGKYLGCNNYAAGNAFFRDKAKGDADKFVITEYVAPVVNITKFTIPAEAFHKSSIDMDLGNDTYVSQIAFNLIASEITAVDKFEPISGTKTAAATVSVDGQSRHVNLTVSSYDGSSYSISGFPSSVSDGTKAFTVAFPEGFFKCDNGDYNGAFEYSYDPEANRVTYTFSFFNSDTSASVPTDLAVVYANAPEGDQYTNGSSYVALYTPTTADFKSLNPYWEIDPQRSNVNGTNINLYFAQQPYKYYVTIEGNDNATVTVKGRDYSNQATVETYQLLTDDDVTYNAYRGYTLGTTELTQPADGKAGTIYVKYEQKPVVYATVDRTDPATGVYDLNDHLDGLSSINVYLTGDDEFTQFGYYASDGNMPEGINVTDAQGNVTNYAVGGIMSWNGYSFCIVNFAKPIREAGTFTINIPAGVLPLADEEKVSPEMHLTYEVKAATVFEIDNRDGVTAQGNRKDNGGLKTLTGFEITAPEGVIFDAIASDAKLYMQGEMNPETWTYGDPVEIEGVTFSFGTTKQTVLVNFSEPYAPEASESYTFILPAGTITATDGRTNKEISLSAYVDPVEYFDLVVTYPAEDNAEAPVDHITVQLPEGLTVTNVDGYILFNGRQAQAGDYTFDQNGRDLIITFAENAVQAGGNASYYFGGSVITATDASKTVWSNNWKEAYNIPVTAAPVKYLVEFAGLEGVALPASPAVTYNNEQYSDQKLITATDLTVEQLQATDVSGYEYTITINEPGYELTHGFGRILVTYSKALNLVAVPFDLTQWAPNAQGVSVANGSWNEIWGSAEGADQGWGIIRVTSANPIRKVVMTVSSDAASVMEKDAQGAFAVNGNTVTWTGNAAALVFSASEDIYVQSFVVYYEKVETVADVAITSDYVNLAEVSSVPSVLTLHLATPASATHSYYAGQTDIPEGVRLFRILPSSSDEHDVTIKAFNYFAGQDYVNIELEETQKLPGTYRLYVPADIIPCGVGHTNDAYTTRWLISKFPIDEVTVLGDQKDGSNVYTEIAGLEVVPAEGLTFSNDNVLYMTADGAYPTVTYMLNDDEVTVDVTSVEILDNGHLKLFFAESIADEGVYLFNLPSSVLRDADYFVNAEVGDIRAFIDVNTYFNIVNADGYDNYNPTDCFDVITITSNWEDWSGFAADVTKELFIAGEDEAGNLIYKKVTVSYYDVETAGEVTHEQEVAGVDVRGNEIALFFDEYFTVPFDTEYTVSFPKGFIDFPYDHVMSNGSSFDQMMKRSYDYRIVYDETVPEGAQLYRNEYALENGASFGSIAEMTDADFTATPVEGANTIITVVQPEADNDWEGSITLSYETIEPVPFDGHFTLNGTPSNLGEDFLCSLSSITIPAPEGHTFLSADDCVLLIQGNTDTEYTHYESVTATISEDGSEVTITLTPAYSTPGFATGFKLAEGSLILDNGADYIGFNCSVSIFPEYAFNIDHSDPADQAVIYNGELKSIDLYLPAGLSVGTNGDLGIEVVGNGYVESFQPASIYGVNGQYVHVQLPESMDLPTGRITVTIPAGMLFYYDYENNDRLTVNAPYTLWIDNFNALQLVTEPAAGTVVGLDAIRVKGERGTLWNSDTNAETLAQSVHFSTYEGHVAVNTTIENGVLVVTPVETLAEGYYTLTIDGLAGTLESADVAASVNAPARFEFNVVGSTFAFQGAQPYDGKTISELTDLETISLNLGWGMGSVSVSEQAGNEPIAVTLIDGQGTVHTVIEARPSVSENQWGESTAQLVGQLKDFTPESTPNGKYNVSLTIPAGIFVSENGRTNEAMTLQYIYDSNKYFAVSPNFESWGHMTGPVNSFILTAAEGVTFTGIAPDKVADPENGVDRPTVFKGGSYLTWANPVISADGKSVSLTLADPISADSPYDQYYLVVPDGLFTGTLATDEGVTFPATSTGFGVWQQVFYVDAPAYDHVEISGPVENGESITSYGGYIYVYVNKTIGGDDGIPAGTTFTSADGQSVDINNMWSVWSSDCSYFVVNTASNLQPGTYTLHVPADSRYADGVIDFTFTLVETFDLADGTFAPTGTVEAQTLESFTWTAPEGKTIQSVDVTKIDNWGYDDNSNWTIIPLAGLTYEIAGEKNQVVFTLAEPITVSEGQTTASLNLSFQGAAIVCADGSMSKSGSYSVTIDPYPNDINRDGKEDSVDDAIAISDIILRMDRWYENNTNKADLNGDGEVTIGDLVKYIQQLQPSVDVKDEPVDELGD